MEAKFIGDKAKVGRNVDMLHPSCYPCDCKPNETSRRIWLVLRRSIGGHDVQPKPIGLYSAKCVG